MRKSAAVLLFAVVLLVVPVAPSHAWSGHGGGQSGWHGGGQGGWHGGAWGGPGGWHGGAWGGQNGWHGGGWGWQSGWHGSVIIGAPWWGPVYSYPYAYPYPYYPPYYPYPPAVVQAPSVYVQQPSAASTVPAQTYWYYCASAKAYYPNVPKCREAWIKVPPTPQ
jgi:hypothetical protein